MNRPHASLAVASASPPVDIGVDEVETYLSQRLGDLPHMSYAYEREIKTLWVTMRPEPFPCFTQEMTDSFLRFRDVVAQTWGRLHPHVDQPIRFVVLKSSTPATFSTGGDLSRILPWLEARDHASLREYFHKGTRCISAFSDGFGASLVTIAAVSGKVYGGGFEAARACDFIVADETARFALPEWRFGLFPGNGAFNLIGLRHGEPLLHRLLLDGAILNVREAEIEGIVKVRVPAGETEKGARDLVASLYGKFHICLAVRRGMQRLQGVSLKSMLDETDRYLATALDIGPDFESLRRIVAVQKRAINRGRD